MITETIYRPSDLQTVLIMTIAKQLALLLVKETIAEKKRNKQVPSYAFGLEILSR